MEASQTIATKNHSYLIKSLLAAKREYSWKKKSCAEKKGTNCLEAPDLLASASKPKILKYENDPESPSGAFKRQFFDITTKLNLKVDEHYVQMTRAHYSKIPYVFMVKKSFDSRLNCKI